MGETQRFKTARNKVLRTEMSIHRDLSEQLATSELMPGSRRVLGGTEVTIVKGGGTVMS